MDLRASLQADFDRRARGNPRYSMRAFALRLGVSHSSLLRFLQPGRRITPRSARRLGSRLGWTPAQIAVGCAQDQERILCQWLRHPGFRPDSRWLSVRSGLPLDRVNIMLQHLLHAGRLTMAGPDTWLCEDT